MEREIKKEKERVKKRISAHLVKKSASDVSNGGSDVSHSTAEEVSNSEDDDDVDCPVCHVRGLSCQWIYCNVWYHTHCTDADPDDLPDMFHCLKCV